MGPVLSTGPVEVPGRCGFNGLSTAKVNPVGELEAELASLISRSHELNPADCTDQQICHIVTATT